MRIIPRLSIVLCALLLAGIAHPAWAFGPDFPPLTGRVVDQAGILSPATRDRLNAMLIEHERATTNQVVVVTLASLQGYTIENFGYQLGRHWGIGQKGKNNGVLLIIAPNERKVRIEVGYGLEGILTDADSRVIIERDIKPAFKQGDYDTGTLDGTRAILHLLSNTSEGDQSSEPLALGTYHLTALTLVPLLVPFWMFLVLMIAVSRRRHRYWLYRSPHYPVGIGYPGGFGSGGFGGGGFGGGGFSGGGGSFGGGGASGGW